jgi:hypothetical protein
MKRLGPDLKMPDLKTPDFLVDLLYDLRDRRLLAPIALVVVAIAAVPFLLGGGSDESSPTPVEGAATAPAEPKTAKAATLTVVEAKPGLRDYRKRLAARKPTDPFKQRYAALSTAGAELNQTESSSSSSTSTTITTGGPSETTISRETTTSAPAGTPSSPPAGTSPSQPPSGGGKHHLTFYTWGIDVRISKSGGESADPSVSEEPIVKHNVLPQTSLPGEKAPVVTYMGLSRKAGKHHAAKALLLVSDKVKSVSGEAKCVSGGKVCQLLEVESGSPVTFVYGANETRYTIKLLKVELVVTGHS